MYKYFTNRAIGLLYHFLLDQGKYIDTWLLPSQICFSVPYLFLKLGKKVIFYDFGFSHIDVLRLFTGKEGVLIVDYFGTEWDIEQVSIIKDTVPCLIHDKCLSVCNPDYPYKADLTIFSSGKGKVVDMGYGGFGIAINKLNIENKVNNLKSINYENFYNKKDFYWKQIINGNRRFCLREVSGSWIDIYSNLIDENYEKSFFEKQNKSIQHKNLLNQIYRSIIPADLYFHQTSNIWRFNLLITNKSKLLNSIFMNNLFASSHYVNVAKYIMRQDTLVRSDIIENHIVNLFNDFNFDIEKAERCARIVRSLFERNIIRPKSI
ncbi:MAG: hypothetical protein NZ519_11530 [Bacteroidia bacterium]|nr:hypothetical protein [Bacteroidia bacterium]MDW8302561.1 hypothetical protein [Bacteroidia bacterium]